MIIDADWICGTYVITAPSRGHECITLAESKDKEEAINEALRELREAIVTIDCLRRIVKENKDDING